MSKKKNLKKRYLNKEFIILLYFLINFLFMCVGGMIMKWDSWIPALTLLIGLSCLVVYIGKYWDFVIRSVYFSIAINICLVLYGISSDAFTSVLIPYMTIIVVIGFYYIEELMIIPTISMTFLVIFHRFVLKSFQIRSSKQFFDFGVPIFNVYALILVIYILVRLINSNNTKINSVIDNLKKAEQGKDDFLANVSHEIRTPVNSVTGMSEIILREELPEQVRENVRNIQISGMKLVALVSDILDFSELSSGKQQIIEAPYDVRSVIKDVVDLCFSNFKEKDIEFIIQCDVDVPSVLVGDEQKLVRVVKNILDNAFKFTQEGYVMLSISQRREDYGTNLSISVTDSGIGIDDEHLEKLFDTYNQVDTKRNRQEGGIGLGLAISKFIVESMGGFITVDSVVGKGSKFKIVLPQKIADESNIININAFKLFSVLIYVNMENIENISAREAYRNSIENIVIQFKVQNHFCHNLSEFKRRAEKDYTSHAFITLNEYLEDAAYFDQLAMKIPLIVLVDKTKELLIHSSDIIKMYKPFGALALDDLFNGKKKLDNQKFIAPEAKILVVDDNLINLKVISGLLKPYKMQIVTAESGHEALEKIESKDYDLVLLDHMMPEMDGIETLQKIRDKQALYFKEVPIIALTANAIAGAREMFIEEGFQEFVSKPVEITYLDKVIRAFIPSEKFQYVENEEIKTDNTSDIKSETKAASIDSDNANPDSFEANVDVEQGSMYCGSYEDLMDVLKIHLEEASENKKNIQRFFEEQDWKNYTILVHGLKSSMKSVGVNKLSEMARLLESAGKSEDAEYINANHSDMMDEYDRIVDILNKHFGIDEENQSEEERQKEPEIDLAALTDLSSEDFDNYIDQLEQVTFSWDEESIVAVLDQLEVYKYKDKALLEVLDIMRKKVEMSDYMSACETLKNWKEKQNGKA